MICIQITMVSVSSVRVSDFAITLEVAKKSAEARTTSAASCTASTPGRRITRTPMKPAATAITRCRDRRSPRNKAASRATHNGVENSSAVTAASGSIATP